MTITPLGPRRKVPAIPVFPYVLIQAAHRSVARHSAAREMLHPAPAGRVKTGAVEIASIRVGADRCRGDRPRIAVAVSIVTFPFRMNRPRLRPCFVGSW